MSFETAKIGHLVLEVVIEAGAEPVWRALTEEIDAWWPDPFYAGGDPASRRFVLEAEPGGRMYEDWGEDGGLLWATVLTVERQRRLEVVGHASPRWGGPSSWIGHWSLEPESGPGGERVRLRFEESSHGRVDGKYVADKEKGWSYLFAEALKAHVEGSEPPPWDE